MAQIVERVVRAIEYGNIEKSIETNPAACRHRGVRPHEARPPFESCAKIMWFGHSSPHHPDRRFESVS
jgi:hypothetical protein